MANSSKKVRVRFAPSPTGYVHIGSLRTALFNFLFARHEGGDLILRVEDTDQNRYVEGAVENLLRVMKELGIEFDEGLYLDGSGKVARRGEHGPYVQSERLDIYLKHAQQLVVSGKAYYCFCDEQRLDDLRKEQIALKKPPMYDRFCRKLSDADIAAKLEEFQSAGKRPVIRQAIPAEGSTTLHDIIYGDIVFEHSTLDDQILLKSDGFPTYHLAVVVDDHHMEITHVLRGEEWISSTPKHLLLYQAFGWEPTAFAHLPLILNKDKSKLSKRQGDVSVEDFLAKGYLRDALLNFVAFLGWNPKTEQEIFSLQDLIAQFDLAKVNKAAAILDPDKLDWMNGLYIRHTEIGELAQMLLPYWQEAGATSKEEKPKTDYLERVAKLEQERLKKLSEIGERTKYFFAPPEYDGKLLVWKKSTAEDAKDKLTALYDFFHELPDSDFEQAALEQKLKEFISLHNFDNGSVLWPLRVSMTGLDKSPGPFEVVSVLAFGLGKQQILDRLKTAINKL